LYPRLFTEQSYSGQTPPTISFAQKGDPFTWMHPVQLLLKNSQTSHLIPQAEIFMVFEFILQVTTLFINFDKSTLKILIFLIIKRV
jgi:hypothetical protein